MLEGVLLRIERADSYTVISNYRKRYFFFMKEQV